MNCDNIKVCVTYRNICIASTSVVILLASEIYQVQQHCSVNVYADIKKMSIQRSAVDKTLTGGEVKLMLFLSVHDIMCTGGY